VNWADFPSLVALENGMLVAQWSVKASGNPYSANLEIATSNNDGRSWSRPESPHKQQSNSEHGFAALSDSSMGRFAAFWLDGRNFSADPNKAAMMLVYSQYEGGRFSQESILDERVCDCCQTDAAPVPGGMIVVYRDRSSAEVRDIYYRKNTNGVWSKAKPLWNDGWKIEACPVNGPAISSFASHVAIAWFTGASNQPRVQIIFSADGGETFGKAIRIDNGNPIGRVDVDWLQNQNAMVTWMENNGEIRARLIRPDGSGEQSFVVAKSSNSQASGFPRLARFGKGAIVSWTDVKGEQLRVKVAAAIPN
jgi:hypothetical protein